MKNNKKLDTGQPGSLSKKQQLEEIIRVNQAGEYGAKRIYAGQLAVLKNSPMYQTIDHMAKQEEVHLEYFSKQIAAREVRPTLLMPLWHIAGFAMGAVTSMLGEKSAMACTVAVEEVIDEHYREQLAILGNDETELKSKIEDFRQEELEHRNIGVENMAKEAPFYPMLHLAVRSATKLAIFLSKRI